MKKGWDHNGTENGTGQVERETKGTKKNVLQRRFPQEDILSDVGAGVDLGLLLRLTLSLLHTLALVLLFCFLGVRGGAPGVSPVVHHEGLPWVLFVDVANQVNLLADPCVRVL